MSSSLAARFRDLPPISQDEGASGLSFWRLEQRRQLLGAGAPALVEPHGFMGFDIGFGPMPHRRAVKSGDAGALEIKDARHEGLFGRKPSGDIGVSKDKAPRRRNLEKDSAIGK